MIALTRKLGLSAIGGGLLVLGVLSAYNMITESAPFFSIPAFLFVVGGGLSLWKAFE